jgi:hypothetical protein
MNTKDKQLFKEMPFKKKCEHIWYYFKIHILVAIGLILVSIFLVRQCQTTVKPDIVIHIATNKTVMTLDQQNKFSEYVSSLIEDSNKDGKKYAQCLFLSFDSQDANTIMANKTRLIGDLQLRQDVLYIFDDGAIDQMTGGDLSGFTKIHDVLPGVSTSDPYKLPISDTTLSQQSFADPLSGTSILIQSYSEDGAKQSTIDRINNAIALVKTLTKK